MKYVYVVTILHRIYKTDKYDQSFILVTDGQRQDVGGVFGTMEKALQYMQLLMDTYKGEFEIAKNGNDVTAILSEIISDNGKISRDIVIEIKRYSVM